MMNEIETRKKSIQILQSRWFGLSSESTRMIVLFGELKNELTPYQITLIINRYVSITESLHSRTNYFAVQFHVGRTVITVGSIFVSALLSIQYINTSGSNSPNTNTPSAYFWVTWVISLFVTICNGVLTLFKVDKKYYFLHTTLESLKSEAWQYLHLTGKYAGHYTKGQLPTHANQYVFFCHNIEKIKLKQVEEEYYKLIESTENSTNNHHTHQSSLARGSSKNILIPSSPTGSTKNIAGLYMPTPEQQTLLTHQKELMNALVENGITFPTKVDGGLQEKEIADSDA
jgi:hypothetical protein